MRKISSAILLFTFAIFSCNKPSDMSPEQIPNETALKNIHFESTATAAIHLTGFPDFLIADDTAVWVTNIDHISKLVLSSDTAVAKVDLPSPCGAGVEAFGSLWVASCASQSIYRIDKNTLVITAIIATGLADPQGELSLAAGAGSVWVLTKAAGVLSRIDPNTNTIIHNILVKPNSYAAAFGFDAVWISNTGTDNAVQGSVQKIDPSTNSVVATITVGHVPHFIAAGEGGVWVLNQGDGSVSHIDPVTNTVASNIRIHAIGTGGDITAGAGSVWVRAKNAFLIEIDPVSNKVLNTYMPPKGSGAVRVTSDNVVWASAHDVKMVWAFQK